LPGVVLTAALVAAVAWLLGRVARARRPATLRRRWVFRLGAWKVPLAVLAAALVVLLVGVPAANLSYKAGVVVERVGEEWIRSWSPGKWLATVATSPLQYRREIGWSLLIGALAAAAAVALGILLAWPLRQAARPRGALWMLLLLVAALGLAVPGPALGIAIIRLLNQPGRPWLLYLYDDTIFAPWLALTLRAMPLAWLVLWHAIRSLPPAMLDAAAVDGAGSLRQLWSVALPNRRPAVAMAWIVAFAVALGELGASILVVPPGVTTLSIRIFDLLHSGAEDPVAGISLALLAVFAALAGVAWLAAARWSGGPLVRAPARDYDGWRGRS
jgi:iron(III) transport system permease protein